MRVLLFILLSLLCGRLQSQTIQNWKKLDYGPTPFQPFSIAETRNEVFAVAYGKLFKSSDDLGTEWEEVGGLPEGYSTDRVETSSKLLVVLLRPDNHESSGFYRQEMYVSDNDGASFFHARTVIHEEFGSWTLVNVTGNIITYNDGDGSNQGDPRHHISYNKGRTWQDVTNTDLLFIRETEPGKLTYRDNGVLHVYDEVNQAWDEIPLPAVFSTTDYFTLGDTIATIKDYILHLYIPNNDRVIREASTIQNLPSQLRRRGELYLGDDINLIIGMNRGRTWVPITYSSPSSLTSQGWYSYAAKNNILFFCNDFEAFDIGDPTQPLQAVRYMQNEDHYRALRPLNDESFLSRIREKTVVNFHDTDGNITNGINAINFNTARIAASNQTIIATWPEGIRVRKSDGSARLTFGIEMQPRSLQCIGDTCVFVSSADELYMSIDAGENWSPYSVSNLTSFEADALTLQPNGMYVGSRNTNNSDVSVFYHDFDNLSTLPVTEIDWRVIFFKPSFRITNYNLWFTDEGIYRAFDNTGELELLHETNFPFIKYWGDNELVRVSNVAARGDSIIASGSTSRPFVSTDRGESWTEWAGPLPSGRVNDVILVGGKFLLATNNGLFLESSMVSSAEETIRASISKVACFPNPAAPGHSIQLTLPNSPSAAAHASIAFFSTDGRLVAAEQDYPTTAGQVTVPGIQQTGSYCIVGEVDGRWFSSMVVIK